MSHLHIDVEDRPGICDNHRAAQLSAVRQGHDVGDGNIRHYRDPGGKRDRPVGELRRRSGVADDRGHVGGRALYRRVDRVASVIELDERGLTPRTWM